MKRKIFYWILWDSKILTTRSFIEKLVEVFIELKKYDPLFFYEIVLPDSKEVIEFNDTIIQHLIDWYMNKYGWVYKKYTNLKISESSEFTHRVGDIKNHKNKGASKVEITFSTSDEFVHFGNGIILIVSGSHSFEWHVGLFKHLTENMGAKFCYLNDYYLHLKQKELFESKSSSEAEYLSLCNGFDTGIATYLNDTYNIDDAPKNILIEPYFEGNIFYCTEKQFYNSEDPTHNQNIFDLKKYFGLKKYQNLNI